MGATALSRGLMQVLRLSDVSQKRQCRSRLKILILTVTSQSQVEEIPHCAISEEADEVMKQMILVGSETGF